MHVRCHTKQHSTCHAHAIPRLQVSALSNAAGVGGGAIFVPLFNVLLGFSIKNVSTTARWALQALAGRSAPHDPCRLLCPALQATALSQAVITGGALGSVAYSITRQHPRDPGRPLVDWDLALPICPGLLLGVSTGVLLNIALPAW